MSQSFFFHYDLGWFFPFPGRKLSDSLILSILQGEYLVSNDPQVTVSSETDASQLNSQLTLISGEIDALLIEVNGFASTLSGLQTSVEVVESSLGTAETNIIDLSSSVVGLTADISSLQSSVGVVETSLGVVTTDVTTLGDSVTSLSGEVTSLQTDVSALGINVSTVIQDVTTLDGRTTDLETATSSIAGDVTTLQSDLIALDASLSADLSSLTGTLSTLQTDVTGIESDVTGIESEIGILQAQVDSLLQPYPTVQTAAQLQSLINASGAIALTIGPSLLNAGQAGTAVTLLAGQTLILLGVENLEFSWTWNAPLNDSELRFMSCKMGPTYVDPVHRLNNSSSLGLLTFSMTDCLTDLSVPIDDFASTQAGGFQ